MRKIEEIASGIYQIKNFISEESCSFIINNLEKNLIETPRPYIYGFMQSRYPEHLSIVEDGSGADRVTLDFVNSLFLSMGYIVSSIYKEDHILKQTFYSLMLKGSENGLHSDNYYIDESGELQVRVDSPQDKSAVLYLNNEYSGGLLEFPENNISIKPDPGTLIVFEGDESRPHRVNIVEAGLRYNLITFFEPKKIL